MAQNSPSRRARPRTVTGPPGRGRPRIRPETYRPLTPFQDSVNRLERDLYRSQQKRINETLLEYTDDFKRYERQYRRTVQRAIEPSDNQELIAAAKCADVILVGDYHTHPQSQRAFFRLLRAQSRVSRDVVIGLEMIQGKHQASIDKYLAGRISEKTFLRRIEHEEHWPFGPFETVRPIFDLAKERGWRIMGIDSINHSGTVRVRDEFAAECVVNALTTNPKARVFVLIGEMHLAPPHLPRCIEKQLKKANLDKNILRIHQNPEAIWFDFASRGLAIEHDVVRVSDDAFALLTASPVVCQQTYLTWLEQLQEGDNTNDSLDPEIGEKHVKHAVQVIDQALGLKAKNALRTVQVTDPSDLAFFELLQHSGIFNPREIKAIRKHILSVESCYIPKARLIYLATLSMNHAAEEAAHMLRHYCSQEDMDDPKSLVDAFYFRIMNEAIAFLGSKIVNPKRKCSHEEELQAIARAKKPLSQLDKLAATMALDHKRMERGTIIPHLSDIFQAPSKLFNAVTHLLGYILGDKLYYALVRNKITAEEARSMFFEPLGDEGAAMLMYFEWVNRVGNLKTPKRP